jgi:hypothetical protein
MEEIYKEKREEWVEIDITLLELTENEKKLELKLNLTKTKQAKYWNQILSQKMKKL